MQDIEQLTGAVGARPFIKWAGGKARLVPELLRRLPDDASRRRHVEPFVGGGALFFARRPPSALLCDSNGHLIDTYKAVRNDLARVLDALETLATEHSEETFLKVRALMNHAELPEVARAAMFIYLNKTAFNGLYRVNQAGEFNVPFGRYLNPKIRDPLGLTLASAVLQRAELACQDFVDTLERCGAEDFVYLDPPYMPMTDTSFTAYTPGGFGDNEQARLADAIDQLDARGGRFLLSQSDHASVRARYARYHVEEVTNVRNVSCKGEGRGRVTELLIRNYQTTC